MKIVPLLALIGLSLSVSIRSQQKSRTLNTPTYEMFTASYFLSLPYVSISVPQTAYADVAKQLLRISSFSGRYEELHRYDLNMTYARYIAANQPKCMQYPDQGDVSTLAPLPDLSGYTYIGFGQCPDSAVSTEEGKRLVAAYRAKVRASGGSVKEDYSLCDVWELGVQYGPTPAKFATAQFFAFKDQPYPVQLHIFGHNNITQSHFDTYVFDYFEYESAYSPGVFNPFTPCANNTPPGLVERTPAPRPNHLRTAMSFLLSGEKREAHLFSDFVNTHGKIYTSIVDHVNRRSVFSSNLRKIEAHNSDDSKTFKMKVNHFADLTEAEYRRTRTGCKSPSDEKLLKKRMLRKEERDTLVKSVGDTVPDFVDWVSQGAVWPPKDQGWCGSCWTFGAVGAIEGFNQISTGKLVSLSEQNILDCDWNGVGGCGGGDHVLAWEWLLSNQNGTIATDKSYSYTVTDGYCMPSNMYDVGATFSSYSVIPSGDEEALKAAIYKYGPAAVAIDASHSTFGYYSSGVYYEPSCGNTTSSLDHVVLAVGYGTDPVGGDYWLIKNSWSDYWGNEGYVRMSRRNNNCGVATEAGVITA